MPTKSPKTPVIPLTNWVRIQGLLELFPVAIPTRFTLDRMLKQGLPVHQPTGPRGVLLFDPLEVDEWLRSRCSTRPGHDDDGQAA